MKLSKYYREAAPKFYHNKDKKGRQVTTCVLTSEVDNLPIPYGIMLPNNISRRIVKILQNDKVFDLSGGKYVVTAKVICHENDTYDKTLGEKLALAKARQKTFHYWRNAVAGALYIVHDYIGKTIRQFNMKFYDAYCSECDFFKKLQEK